jgi:hypothetical protein
VPPLPVSSLCSLNEAVLPLQLVRRYTGGHKGPIACLMTFMSAAGEVSDCITVVFDACFAFFIPNRFLFLLHLYFTPDGTSNLSINNNFYIRYI